MDPVTPKETLGRGLSKLPRIDKSGLVASFVKEQQRNSKIYQAEGSRYRESWTKEGASVFQKSPSVESRIGITTPILKARNPRHVLQKAQARTPKGGLDKSESSKRGAEKPKEATLSKENAAPGSRPTKNQSLAQNKKRACTKSSDAEDTDSLEHRKRLDMRKERKRKRREIVNPKKRKSSMEREDTSGDDTEDAKSKRPKIPAGLALMHGFSATNVGKSRLTLEPGVRYAGVFSRGKASAKASTSKGTAAFSEHLFLNRPSGESREAKHNSETRGRRQSSKKAQKPEKKSEPKERRKASSESDLDTSRSVALRIRSSSITWDIERDSPNLASTVAPIPTALDLLDQTNAVLKDTPDKRRSSLAPQDSASQCASKSPSYINCTPDVNVLSKYFRPSVDEDKDGCAQETGSPEPGHAPLLCSSPPDHRQSSYISMWQETGFGLPQEEGKSKPDILEWQEAFDEDLGPLDPGEFEERQSQVSGNAYSPPEGYVPYEDVEPEEAWWEQRQTWRESIETYPGEELDRVPNPYYMDERGESFHDLAEHSGWQEAPLEDEYNSEYGEFAISSESGSEPEANDGLCQFLGGRSALLGLELNPECRLHGGVSAAESDVARRLKNHWRPQTY